MRQFLIDFLRFIRREKKWWLAPLLLIVVAAGLLLFLSTGSGISWALYPSK